MAADVPGAAVFVDDAARQPADLVVSLIQQPIVTTPAMQGVRGSEAGRAGADQIQELVEMIEDDDVDVNVTRTGDGLYVLRATGFDDDDMLENGVLEINYRENVGVESLVVRHVGRYDGTIRLELGVPDFDEDLLSIERFENDGKTRVFKVSDFTSLLESLMGAADEDK